MSAKSLFLLSLLAAVGVQAAPLSFKAVSTTVRTNCVKSSWLDRTDCHELEVAYPQTGDKALDAWARRQMQKAVGTKNLSPKALKAFWLKNEEVAGVNKDNKELEKDDSACHLSVIHTLQLEGQTPNYAVFGEEDWGYHCGPHGNGTHTWSVVKRGTAKPKALALKDILLPGGRAKLVKLQKTATAEGLLKEYSDDFSSLQDAIRSLDDYNGKNFKGTDNWRFAKGGLMFEFQSYEIGPYLLGRPAAYIPLAKLKGIVKPEILREAAHYQISPDILKEDKNAR